jgi:hypothetical protein
MDDYPEQLSPPKDQGGGIDRTKFASWWAKVKPEFPTVPENVGQYFLHEHWGRSPYGSMKSRAYEFDAVKWESTRLFDIRSTWDNFDPECKGCIVKGRELATQKTFGSLDRTAEYMLQHRNFPSPIIVLDNHDGHLNNDYPKIWPVPSGLILIEGHSRFNIATYLQTKGALNPTVDVWFMKKVSTEGTSRRVAPQ